MKLSHGQLLAHLKNNLLPVYLVAGNEPLLIQEARDDIKHSAKQQGFVDVQRFEANKDFDWQSLLESANALSLFSDKSFVDIKLNQKPNAAAAKIFTAFLEKITPDKIVLISCEKLDAATSKSSGRNTATVSADTY